ncbi:manganese efflux pump, partial [Methanoregula sp.]|uniref:manganese efflux pump MntP n=1 Tax=Methanoregula sp. TaxID=2052170 RepID=UPI000CC37C81
MDLVTPVVIGIALAMDCLAVSLAIGTSTKENLLKTAIIIALCFGAFQAGMTLIGWAAGTGLTMVIAGFDHWVAFILLVVIGAKMIHEGFGNGQEEKVGTLQFLPVMILSL